MTNKLPIQGMIILKRLNTKETEAGISLKDLEYVFAAEKWTDIVNHLCKFPKNRLSWLIVAQFETNEAGELVYDAGKNAIDFLETIQKKLYHEQMKNGIILN